MVLDYGVCHPFFQGRTASIRDAAQVLLDSEDSSRYEFRRNSERGHWSAVPKTRRGEQRVHTKKAIPEDGLFENLVDENF